MSTTNDADGIQFADESGTPPLPPGGGVYTVHESEKFVPTLTKRSTGISEKGVEFSADDTDERDIKKKQQFKGRYLFWSGLLLSFSICLFQHSSWIIWINDLLGSRINPWA